MDITFYLNDKRVQKAYFKQFSSRSHIWLKLLERYSNNLQKTGGTLKLVYVPVENKVEAEYDKTNTLLNMLHEEASQVSFKDLMHSQPGLKILASHV